MASFGEKSDLMALGELQEMVKQANIRIENLVEKKKVGIANKKDKQKQEATELKGEQDVLYLLQCYCCFVSSPQPTTEQKRSLQQKLVETIDIQQRSAIGTNFHLVPHTHCQ